MNKLKNLSTKAKTTYLSIGTAAMTAIMMIMPAYASNAIASQINGGLKQVYTIITAIVLPIGAIVAAICAVKWIMGGPRDGEGAKNTLIRIVIGIAIVYLAPFLVETISGWFSGTSASIW